MTEQPLAGKSALVTGAATGIGRASALALAGAGASVLVADLDDASATAQAIAADGGRAEVVRCDIAMEDDVRAAVEAAVRAFGSLDVLHANAGLGHGQSKLADIDRAGWDRTISVNFTGTWLCLRYAIRQMVSQATGGAIVVTSSATGLSGYPGVAGYAATKAALISLTKTAALEYADDGIRVNAVAPGPIATDMVRRAMEENPALGEHLRQTVPLHRVGTVEEVAAAVVWLSSPAASYVTGAVLSVDGGQKAG